MPKVLLIDDDVTMISLLRTLLQLDGFDVSTIEGNLNLENALEAVRRETPDILLLDVHLRQLNGFDVLKEIRQQPDLKELGILMTSGMDVSEECERKGADGFLLKPYMPDILTQQIRSILGSKYGKETQS